MKLICLFLLNCLVSNSIWSSYEDNADVQRLVKAGHFEMLEAGCSQSDALLLKNKKLCLNIESIPSSVSLEVDHMLENELENESDYDQRVTSLFHFSSQNLNFNRVDEKAIEEFFAFGNVDFSPDSFSLSIAEEIVDHNSFREFNDLFVDLFFKSNSKTQSFIRDAFMGEEVKVIKFDEGVELYPGGGFYVSHYLILGHEHGMYVKFSWWNS